MAEETTTETTETTETETTTEDQRVPYERFEKVNKDAREAKEAAKAAQKRADDLERQLKERDEDGLPELEKVRKAAEAADKRAAEAEARAEKAEHERERTRRERWVTAAAAEQNFEDPEDATRFVDLDDIEDADAAARAVKNLGKKKKHLLKPEEPTIPGRVLANGQRATSTNGAPQSNIDLGAEAEGIAAALAKFQKNRS